MKKILVEFTDGTVKEILTSKIKGVFNGRIDYLDENGENRSQSTIGAVTRKHATVTITEIEERAWQVVKGTNTDLVWHQKANTFFEESEIVLKDKLTLSEAEKMSEKIQDALEGR